MIATLHSLRTILKRFDWWLIAPIVFLLAVGISMQYTIAVNQDVVSMSSFYKQLLFLFVGLGFFFLFSLLDYRLLRLHPVFFAVAGVLILLFVLLFGTTIKGTTGWFVVGGISLQPVEFVKMILILFLATYVERTLPTPHRLPYLLTAAGVSLLFAFLVLLQPDLGSAFILCCIWFGIIVVLKAPYWFLGSIVGGGGLFFLLGWFAFFKDYQKARLLTFINPAADPLGAGYNITQSIVAVGSGSFWGRGLGLGTQSQLHFLPEVGSDFIFAAIAEELGFIGSLAVCIAIGLILFRLYLYIRSTKDLFAFVLLLGFFIYYMTQSMFVIGMNMGLLPVTGVPLPLVSAGGSSLLATLIFFGVVHRIGMTQRSK